MERRGNGVEYLDRNREEKDEKKEEMGCNMWTETVRKEMGRRGNRAEYVDRNREESDGEKRTWGGICRQKQGRKKWGEEETRRNM
jgi:hypothetical protein